MQQLMRDLRFRELGHFVSSKEDWDLYVRPAIRRLQEILANKKELASEARVLLEGFKTEYEAAGQQWDVVMWVAKPQ
jgi:hypothetical protein